MSHLIRPSFSALNTSEKLDRQQSIYVCFGPVHPVSGARDRLFVRRDIAPYTKAFARNTHRHNWPETNVGASASSRCAARAALDLPNPEDAAPSDAIGKPLESPKTAQPVSRQLGPASPLGQTPHPLRRDRRLGQPQVLVPERQQHPPVTHTVDHRQ